MIFFLASSKIPLSSEGKLYTHIFHYFIRNKAKGRISKRVFQESKACQNFRKTNISYPRDTHTYVCISGGKKCLFSGNFGVLCFLETPVLRFALLPYYRRFQRINVVNPNFVTDGQ